MNRAWREKSVHLKWIKMTEMALLDLKMLPALSLALWDVLWVEVSIHVSM